ncbi:MAG: hypothetical protein C4K58_03000 [Flavobacteriaceae bacterium]|nr:MAG: hypothetical protein C4K58_03000 [Flavobacteriaceae bacterium]
MKPKLAVFISLMVLFGQTKTVSFLSKNQTFLNFYKTSYVKWSSLLGRLWQSVPFSVGDLFYFLSIVFFLYLFYRFRLGWKSFLWLSLYVNLLFFVFYLFWGFNYFLPKLETYYKPQEIVLTDLHKTAESLLKECKELREAMPEDSLSLQEIDAHINQGLVFLPNNLPYKHRVFSASKASFFSTQLSYLGVLGYYNPFTFECQYNKKMPGVKWAHTLAHEFAHKLGYAPEDQANFIGYLLLEKSSDPRLVYSAKYKALKSVITLIYKENDPTYECYLGGFSLKMKSDYTKELAFEKKYANKVGDFQSVAYDAFLKGNNQNKGLESYNAFVYLLIAHQRAEKKGDLN